MLNAADTRETSKANPAIIRVATVGADHVSGWGFVISTGNATTQLAYNQTGVLTALSPWPTERLPWSRKIRIPGNHFQALGDTTGASPHMAKATSVTAGGLFRSAWWLLLVRPEHVTTRVSVHYQVVLLDLLGVAVPVEVALSQL